jgi:4-hydroxy-2-oxoheptanedioate aldolase
MYENRFREILRGGKFHAGMFAFIPAEQIVELAAYAGFDFLIFDTEHAPYDLLWIERLVRATEAVGISSVVRLSHVDPYLIARVIDTGTHGLMFARVKNAKEAEKIVRVCRLAPTGDRGSCPGSRQGQYFLMDTGEYTRRTNDVAIALMIESKEALDDAERIVKVPGVDAVAVGPVDLSYTMGLHREHPRIVEAQDHVARLAKQAGIGAMASAKSMDELGQWLKREDGPRTFWYTTDAYQIGNAFKGLIKRSHELVGELAPDAARAVAAA